MSPSPYTEDALVQQTTADYLEQQLGWDSVYAHNQEDFGRDGLLGRASDREVVLTRRLRERLATLNPVCPGRRTTTPCGASRRESRHKPSPPTARSTT